MGSVCGTSSKDRDASGRGHIDNARTNRARSGT